MYLRDRERVISISMKEGNHMQNRRDFLKTTALAGASLALCRGTAWAFGQTPVGLSKFI